MASRESARKFHFLREIASGGFGSVFLAKVMHADGFSRLVAIKLLHRRWSENKEIAQRMRDEARLLGWLRHRNIVDVIDLTSIDGRAAVIMEYLEAIDLKTVIQSASERGERLPPYAGLEVIAFVASALDAAYNRPPYEGEKPLRVIHRDIKPSNIMVDESGAVKVLDFGVARGEFENRESHTQELQFGSVEYMPPERLFFEPETDRADVYSLGATLFEALTGERLGKAKGRAEKHASFLEDRLSFLAASCPLPNPQGGEIARLVREMCAYNADNRPKSDEVVTRARALARQMPGPALAEWAEVVVKPLVADARRAPREPNPLTDAVLSEDSTLFGEAEVKALLGEAKAASVAAPATPVVEEDIPREDLRWELLRQAALAEMGNLPDAPADATDGYEEEPTRIGTGLPALMAAAEAAKPAVPPKPAAAEAARPAAPPKAAAAEAPRAATPANPPESPVASPPVAPPRTAPPLAAAAPSTAAAPAPAPRPPLMPDLAAPRPPLQPATSPPTLMPAEPFRNGPPPPGKPPPGSSAPMPKVLKPPAPAPAPSPLSRPAAGPAPQISPALLDPPSAEELKSAAAAAPPAADAAVQAGLERLRANLTMVPTDDVDDAPTTTVAPMPAVPAPTSFPALATGPAAPPMPAPTMAPGAPAPSAPKPATPPAGAAPTPTPKPATPPVAVAPAPKPATPPVAAAPAPKPATPPVAAAPAGKPATPPVAAAQAPRSAAPATKPAASAPRAEPAVSKPRAAPPRPPEPDPFEDPPPSSGPNLLLVVAAVVGLGILGGLVIGGAWIGYTYWQANQIATIGGNPGATPVPGPPPVPTPAPAPAAAVAGPNDAVFTSAAPDTRSMTVDCGGKEANGSTEVVVVGPVSGPCLVTLVKKDRSRLRADVDAVSAGRWTCFAADAKTCAK